MMMSSVQLQRWGLVAGRIALALVFVHSGIYKLTGWQETAGYMAAKHMPFVPFFLVMAVIFELGGSLLMITGLCPRLGAAMLFAFLVPTTLIFHNFWAVSGPEYQMQLGNFLKNLALLGGLAIAALADWKCPARAAPPA